ncbi:MAG: MFS transporter, partial [Elusimicrobia bacterium]|nr:MFS transporter [Elusimicrobiota bacterium]
RNVLMTEATEPSTRGRAFGFERAMDSAGAVIGPLLALSLLPLLGVRGALALTLIPGLAAALLIALLVEEKKHPPRPELGLRAALAGLPRDFRRFLLGVGVAGVGDFSNTLLILWAGQAWAPRFGALRAASLAIAFYAGYNVVYTLCAYFSGALADRFRKTRVLAAGYACAAVPAAALLWPGASLLKFALVFGLSGLYMGVWETVESAAAAEVLPAEGRGLGFGALATVNGCGDLVSSAVVGSLWALHPALAMGWVIASALCGCAIILGASAGSAARPA